MNKSRPLFFVSCFQLGWLEAIRKEMTNPEFQGRSIKPLSHPSKPLRLLSFLQGAWAENHLLLPDCYPVVLVRLFMAVRSASSARAAASVLHPRHHMTVQVVGVMAMRIMRKIGLGRRQFVKTGHGHMLQLARSAAPCEDHRSGRAARQ